jgi:hypothetical protein
MVASRPWGSGLLARCALVCAFAAPLSACSLILGLDEGLGLPQDDASTDAPAPSATQSGPDGTVDTPDGGPPASTHPMVDGCTPDPSWCDTHCGAGPDNCGETRECPSNCAQGYVCNASNACECQTESGWCNGRCGNTTDNCGKAITCSACTDASSCTPESLQKACGGGQCGQATNNCGQLVNCGPFGLSSLCVDPRQVCLSGGTCCSPNSAGACANRCGTFATDNCGQSVQCPSSCGSGLICNANTCCAPTDPCGNACGVTRTDNCGQAIQCGCSGGAECVSTTGSCCTPQGCGADCFDSCGVPSSACCSDAGPTEAGNLDAAPEAGMPDGGASDAETE